MLKKLFLLTLVFASVGYAVFATTAGRSISIAGLRLPGSQAASIPFGTHSADDSDRVRFDPRSNSVIAEGRVASYPGANVAVGAEITGTLIELCVFENDHVKKGDLIARMRSDDYRANRDLAKADLVEAEAEVEYWTREVARLEKLHTRNASAFSEIDSARRSLAVMVARKSRAKASIEQAEALLAKTRIIAPIDGLVVTRTAHPGETLTVGAPIVKLVDLDRTRVEAEVNEYDVGKISLGTRCKIRAEGYIDQSWSGTVEEIPAEVVPARIRPEDPSRPADTRIVTVKIALDEPIPLKLGQRVYVTILYGRKASAPEATSEAEPEATPESAPRL